MPALKKYSAIAIGASAGGMVAISEILKNLPEDYFIPIVIVQHRGKDSGDLLEEVLQLKCSIRIKQADEKEKLKPGNAYVAPPDYHLLIEKDRTFSLSSEEPVRYSRPSIDVTFESAADVYGKELVAILMSGANNDGSAGIKAIKTSGGFTIVQDPEEAQYPVMPSSAISSVSVDKIADISSITEFLLSIHHAGNEKS